MSILKKIIHSVLDLVILICDSSQKASQENYEEYLEDVEREKRELYYK